MNKIARIERSALFFMGPAGGEGEGWWAGRRFFWKDFNDLYLGWRINTCIFAFRDLEMRYFLLWCAFPGKN
jgi:hypothetical protein